MVSNLYKPYREQGSITNEMENLLQRHFGGLINTGPAAGEWLLPAKIEETDKMLLVTAELPGVTIEDVDLTIDGNVLTIRSERKEDPSHPYTHHLGEKSYGSFRHSISLTAEVLKDNIEAGFDKGILEISLPKAATHRKINISNS